jgi:hypothetical protein
VVAALATLALVGVALAPSDLGKKGGNSESVPGYSRRKTRKHREIFDYKIKKESGNKEDEGRGDLCKTPQSWITHSLPDSGSGDITDNKKGGKIKRWE